MAETTDNSLDPSKSKKVVAPKTRKTPAKTKSTAKPATAAKKTRATKTATKAKAKVTTKTATKAKAKVTTKTAAKTKAKVTTKTAAKTKAQVAVDAKIDSKINHNEKGDEKTLSRRAMLGLLGTAITAFGLGKYFIKQQQIQPYSLVGNTLSMPKTDSPNAYLTTLAGFQTQVLLQSNLNRPTAHLSLIDFPINNCLLTSSLVQSYPQRLLRPSNKSGWLVTAHKDSNQHSQHPLARGGLCFTRLSKDRSGNHLHTKQSVYIGAQDNVGLSGDVVGNNIFVDGGNINGDQVRGIWDVSDVIETPWHSYLACEEDIAAPFIDDNAMISKLPQNIIYGIENNKGTGKDNHWLMSSGRFNHGGWLSEVVFESAGPVITKHTAAGRLLRSFINYQVLDDNRIAIYSGQKQEQGFLFRFITDQPYNIHASNQNIFHSGRLEVAKFKKSGQIEWLHLQYNMNGLDANTGYYSQADVLIYAQKAAIDLGATPLPGIAGITNNTAGNPIVIFTEQSADFAVNNKLFSQLQFGGIIALSSEYKALSRENSAQNNIANVWSIIMQTGRKYVRAHYPSSFTKEKDWLAKPKTAKSNALKTIALIAATDEQKDANGLWVMPQQSELSYHPQLVARTNGDYKFDASLLNFDQSQLLAVISNGKQQLLITLESGHKQKP